MVWWPNAVAAVVSAVVAFKSGDFARRLEEAHNRDERAKLQQEADLRCAHHWAAFRPSREFRRLNRSRSRSRTERLHGHQREVSIPHVRDEPIGLAEMLLPGKDTFERL